MIRLRISDKQFVFHRVNFSSSPTPRNLRGLRCDYTPEFTRPNSFHRSTVLWRHYSYFRHPDRLSDVLLSKLIINEQQRCLCCCEQRSPFTQSSKANITDCPRLHLLNAHYRHTKTKSYHSSSIRQCDKIDLVK